MNTLGQSKVNHFELFMEKVSNVVFDLIKNGIIDWDELFWGEQAHEFKPWEMSEEDIREKEHRKMIDEFLSSLSPEEYRHYFEEQEEVRKAIWELEMVA